MNKYLGHPSQIYGAELSRLDGGLGDGMRLLHVRNGRGLEFTVSADRCADISRLSFRGVNFNWFGPCGYVAPQYYDKDEDGFHKSFTAGFMTTCGITAAGKYCIDEGKAIPQHGNIANVPCEEFHWDVSEERIEIRATVRDAMLFGPKMLIKRTFVCPLDENVLRIKDEITNLDSSPVPYMVLYHCNIGYPLLTENSEIFIPYTKVSPRDARAAEGTANCLIPEAPQPNFREQCYYYELKEPFAAVYNEAVGCGVKIGFDGKALPCFTQWKQFNECEYVLGLEPGNCNPDGRDIVRAQGKLRYLAPHETAVNTLDISAVENRNAFEALKASVK